MEFSWSLFRTMQQWVNFHSDSCRKSSCSSMIQTVLSALVSMNSYINTERNNTHCLGDQSSVSISQKTGQWLYLVTCNDILRWDRTLHSTQEPKYENRDFLEKQTVSQLVRRLPAFYGFQMFIAVSREALILPPILNEKIQSTASYFLDLL